MHSSPCDQPSRPTGPAGELVDRTQRDELAAAIRQFLAESVTAFEFDELVDRFRVSPDSAVRLVAQAVWYHYDDCDDHLVALSKPEWDYFQRLLLLLESNRRASVHRSRRWSYSQLIALCSLLGFLWVAFHAGWGLHLLLAAAPFGIVSMGISVWRRNASHVGPYDPIISPFTSSSGLKSAYDSVAFKKARYPRRLQARRIRSPFMNGVYQLQFSVMWLAFSPIALLFQCLPPLEMQPRVIVE